MNEEPVYNIGVVARMNGINEDTLRMWERRYHFPTPTRTDGGCIGSEQPVEKVLQGRNNPLDAGRASESGQYWDKKCQDRRKNLEFPRQIVSRTPESRLRSTNLSYEPRAILEENDLILRE